VARPDGQGAPVILDMDRRRQLALWGEKTAMVYETTQESTMSATQELREYVRVHQAPNPGTEVWLGRCGTKEYQHRVHHYDSVSEDKSVRGRWDLIGIGEVLLLVSGADPPWFTMVLPEIAEQAGDLGKRMERIWPPSGEDISFPRTDLGLITTEAADLLMVLPVIQTMILRGKRFPEGT
jgi:hypothetical protein